MGALKRLILIVFVIASVLGVGFLTVFWLSWQPLFPFVSWLNVQPWFIVVELVLLGIFLIGILATLIWALVTPGRFSQLVIPLNEGEITISREAIISTAQHVIKKHRGLKTEDTRVKIRGKRNPKLRLRIKIDPGRNGDLTNLGTQLHDEVVANLVAFSGHPVDRLRISFVKSGKADTQQQFVPIPIEPPPPAPESSVVDTVSNTAPGTAADTTLDTAHGTAPRTASGTAPAKFIPLPGESSSLAYENPNADTTPRN